ncbi:DUF6571 family protein [Microtetraspora sp. NBRC 16547]|uniref:DUF6571 family protein n=1 Tax=Microtetraspora sp. NBRC 16547 TaxID=3030993 RepID=UPI0024A1E769|nr:DUF6571 family protein [Microtetraspora sp. NBRC 16547]GLW98435.1 hypothetical protein Misp02_25220 [Microtetraspora sp. NBRC 16547]
MDDFERGLGRAEDALGRNEQRIRRTLQQLDLDTSGLNVLREARSWIETSRPDLRRRSETIRAEVTEWGTSSGLPGGLTTFDEALYGKAAGPDIYAAVTKITEAAESGKVDAKTLAELEKRTGDATFAVALMNAMGAKKFRGLMAKTVKDDDKKVRRLQAALGKTLGTASSRLSNTWRDDLTSDLVLNWREAYAVSLALKHGTFATVFLLSVAKKLDALYRVMAKPIAVEPGVMRTLMEALSRDPAAAQDFFAGDPTALKYYLTEGRMADDGVALGKALEAAMLTFRDHDGSPQNPSRGYLSAKLTSEFVHLEAERIDKGYPPKSFVNPESTGRILAGYVGDVNFTAQFDANIIESGVRGNNDPSLPGVENWGALFDTHQLRQVMKEAFEDSTAFTTVLAAQTVFTSQLLDYGAAEMSAGRGDNTLMTNAKQIGRSFGMITDAAGLAKIEKGKELDEKQERNMKVLTALVGMGLAVPQKAAGAISAGMVGSWTWLIEDAAKGNAETEARSKADSVVRQTQDLVHDLTAQAMLKHGLFGTVEPAAATHPWASLEGLKKGDDPRDNPNNFLKEDGRTLMTKDEMIDKMATDPADKYRRLLAYRQWLHQGPSGKAWSNVENPLDIGFSNGFSQFSS